MPEHLDWTITDAPEPDEAAASLPQRAVRRRSRAAAILTAVFILGAAAAAAAYGAWANARAREAVRLLVLSEQAAARAGDAAAVLEITAAGEWVGRDMQFRLPANSQAAPLPSQALRLLPGEPDPIQITSVASGVLRADVTRAFLTPDGQRLAFTLPQFYRFAQGAWQRTGPPADWTTPMTGLGHYLELSYFAADAEFVAEELGPYLVELLERACASWSCPPDTLIKIQFDASPGLLIAQAPTGALRDDPLLFAFVRSRDLALPDDTLRLAAPRFAGYPADAASAAWLKRAIAVQVLAEAAAQLDAAHGSGGVPSGNAFLYALVAGTLAELDLEPLNTLTEPGPVAVGEADPGSLARNLNLMWNLNLEASPGKLLTGHRDASGLPDGINDPAARERVLRAALAVTNRLLRGQPPERHRALFFALVRAENQVAWLSQAFSTSPDEAWARLQIAAWHLNLPANSQELALACARGIALASPGQPLPTHFQVSYTQGAGSGLAYSPNSQWLAANSASDPYFINLNTGELVRLPPTAPNATVSVSGWVDDTVLAYVLQVSGPAVRTSVQFFDVADPLRELPGVPDIYTYALSPDRKLAKVGIEPRAADINPAALAIMPAWGPQSSDSLIALAPDWPRAGSAWSPDSGQVAFVDLNYERPAFTLRVAEVATGLSREILSADVVDTPGNIPAQVAWSPAGDQLAVVLHGFGPRNEQTYRLGVVNADGAGLRWLRQEGGAVTRLSYSADGRYLAATYYAVGQLAVEEGQTVIYAVPDYEELDTLEQTWSFDWSPAGHQLAVVHAGGVALIPNIGGPERQNLTTDSCSEVRWKPGP